MPAASRALHQGVEQRTLSWAELRGVRRVETMGNVRWYLDGAADAHIVVEGEISERETLLKAAETSRPQSPPPPQLEPPA